MSILTVTFLELAATPRIIECVKCGRETAVFIRRNGNELLYFCEACEVQTVIDEEQ